jgi:hypothetical protein
LAPSLESPAGPPRVVPAWTPYTDLVAAVQDERAVSVLIAMPGTTHNPERYWPVAIQSDGCRAAFNTEPLPTITPDPTRLRELGDCYKPMPVGYWGPYRYIVMTSPRLQAGPQTITTIDISDEADIYVNQAMQAFVCIPDEGHLTALCCDGHGKWVHDAILSVELVRGDADQAREQWEAEMETSEGLGIL